jgi:polygalacturonase
MLRSARHFLVGIVVILSCLLSRTAAGQNSPSSASPSAEPPNPSINAGPTTDRHVFNVRDFGAVGDGKIKDTAAISKAIQAANQSGCGQVLFPAGTYVSGTFEMLPM